jgi:hypothetical protein
MDIVGIGSNVFFATLFGVISMPVLWRWLGWLCCFALMTYFVFDLPAVSRRMSAVIRWTGILALSMIFILAWYSTAEMQWRQEKAASTIGVLRAPGRPSGIVPILDFGDSCTRFLWTGPKDTEILRFLYDAGLRVSIADDGVQISTMVRDASGNVVVEVDENRWETSPSKSVSWDKNYA